MRSITSNKNSDGKYASWIGVAIGGTIASVFDGDERCLYGLKKLRV
jgi:ribosomal silencing factor RsfS